MCLKPRAELPRRRKAAGEAPDRCFREGGWAVSAPLCELLLCVNFAWNRRLDLLQTAVSFIWPGAGVWEKRASGDKFGCQKINKLCSVHQIRHNAFSAASRQNVGREEGEWLAEGEPYLLPRETGGERD